MGSDLGSTDDLVRETYAHFGAAVFLAQTLETEIVNAMVIARLPEKDHISRQEIDAFMNRPITLGQLLKELKKYAWVHDELEQTLQEALEKRNWLVHAYFKERSKDFMSSAGCNLMISELEGAERLFGDATRKLNMSVKPIRERFGITDEVLEREFERQTVNHADWVSQHRVEVAP